MKLGRDTFRARLILAMLFGALFLEGVFFVVQGRFNIDEGMHLNAGRLLYEHGRMLYRDFPFSQGPGVPYLYGAAATLFDNPILAGRLVSLGMGSICVACMAWFAHRVAGRIAVVLVLSWTAVCFPAMWSFTQIRTEPVAMTLTILAAIALWDRRDSTIRMALAPVLLVWATSFRLTSILALLAVCLLIAFELRRSPRQLILVAGIVLANGLVAAMPMLIFFDESYFHVVMSHAGRAERFGWENIPFLFRFRSLAEPATGYPALLLMSALPISATVMHWRQGWLGKRGEERHAATTLPIFFAMALLVYLPHAGSRIGFSQYYANAALLLILALAIGAPLVAARSRRHSILVWSVVAAAWFLTAVSALQRIETWVALGEPTVSHFDSLRDTIEGLSPGECEMLTFETHLAVQVGCDLTPGLEYSLFSFFPGLSSREASVHGVLNAELLNERLVQSPPEFVALTWSAVERIEVSEDRRDVLPILSAMRNRYEPLVQLDVPIGPTYLFWVEIFVYARSDLMDSDDEMQAVDSTD
jgi:hypothetical protein